MPPSLSVSGVTAKNEATFALAAVNFNFSLVTIEPPEEYKILGSQLSRNRRTAAEEGSVHITARKLGALFEQLIDPSPALIKAYGERVSEISRSPVANPKGTSKHGFFRDQVGADGTTIWAAATSGKSAIGVHLLACFLARIWTAPQAISIWVELVESRQKEIMDTLDGTEPSHLAPISAAKQTITRDELTEWDAGARAWLRAGDIVKNKEMKQLKLIINNLELPVDGSSQVYTSVVRAWKTAMDTIGKLISGISYRICDGSVLLALSSWHIYPNMLVLGEKEKYVSQKDPLIPPEVYITIGIQSRATHSGDTDGVYWSLSLARLRHYGSPVQSMRSVGADAERLSFDEFLYVFLGTFFVGWKKVTTDWLLAAKFITAMWEAIVDEAASSNGISEKSEESEKSEKIKEFVEDPNSGISLIYRIARHLLDSDGEEREQAMRLVKTGARSINKHFLTDIDHPSPVFGLTALPTYHSVLTIEGTCCEFLEAINEKTLGARDSQIGTDRNLCITSWNYWERRTPFKYPRTRYRDPSPTQYGNSEEEHHRFIKGYDLMFWSSQDMKTPRYFWLAVRLPKEAIRRASGKHHPLHGLYVYTLPEIERMQANLPTSLRPFKEIYLSSEYNESDLKFIAGTPALRLIYSRLILGIREVPFGVIIRAFQLKRIRIKNLIGHLRHTWLLDDRTKSRYGKSLRCMASAAQLYKLLPGATVAISCAQSSLSIALRDLDISNDIPDKARSSIPLDRRTAFAIVVFFETGVARVGSDILENTMAISTGNSIYVAASLLCDPSEAPEKYELKRVLGNIGRPGVSFMVPPIHPEMRKPTLGNWRQINHHDFDDKVQDSFQSTSLHLSFTGYRQPISTIQGSGACDVESYLVETVVSIYDRGDWVGDVDVIKALESPFFRRFAPLYNCGHTYRTQPTDMTVSIDNWDELLDGLEDRWGVVRANGNWLSRLATTALSVKLGRMTAAVSDKVCWECYREFYERVKHRDSEEYRNPFDYFSPSVKIFIN